MDVELFLEKSAQENAAHYFEQAKKLKREAERVEKAILEVKNKLKRIEEQEKKQVKAGKKPELKKKVEKAWFEKFRFFETSNGFLVIAGRDAEQNEAIAKKHLEKEDLFFHADIQGAAATVIKTGGKQVQEQDLREAAQFAACYSKAWQLGYGSIDVYSALGSQVHKGAPSGEYVPKGGFMIYGKKNWFRNTELELLICFDGKLIAFPAVKKELKGKRVQLMPGNESKSIIAKKILSKLGLEKSLLPALDQLIPGSSRVS